MPLPSNLEMTPNISKSEVDNLKELKSLEPAICLRAMPLDLLPPLVFLTILDNQYL